MSRGILRDGSFGQHSGLSGHTIPEDHLVRKIDTALGFATKSARSGHPSAAILPIVPAPVAGISLIDAFHSN
jgi:hypothetical protein